jgi:hypothetical protein
MSATESYQKLKLKKGETPWGARPFPKGVSGNPFGIRRKMPRIKPDRLDSQGLAVKAALFEIYTRDSYPTKIDRKGCDVIWKRRKIDDDLADLVIGWVAARRDRRLQLADP